MPTLKKIKPKTEKELHSIIEREIDALEEGLQILKYEFVLSKGVPDFLCIDSGGRLVIIEVKLQESEEILFQALRYYNEVDKQRYTIAKMFPDKGINPDQHPRIILIAERFSDDLRQLSNLVVPEVELYEYTVLLTPDGREGICFHPVSLPKVEEIPSKPPTIDELRNYITEEALRPLFDKAREEIKAIDERMEEYTVQSYVGYRYKGRLIAWIAPRRKCFDIGVVIRDERLRVVEYESVRIESDSEDYSEMLEKIRGAFQNIARVKGEI